MRKLKLSTLLILASIIIFSVGSAAMSTINFNRSINSGKILADTDPNVAVRIENISEYDNLLNFSDSGNVSLHLKEAISNESDVLGINPSSLFRIGSADNGVIRITNNSDISVMAVLDDSIGIQMDTTSDTNLIINPGSYTDFYFTISTYDIDIDTPMIATLHVTSDLSYVASNSNFFPIGDTIPTNLETTSLVSLSFDSATIDQLNDSNVVMRPANTYIIENQVLSNEDPGASIFVPVSADNYVIESTASFYTPNYYSTGYGIYIDTMLNEDLKDTGYLLQMDLGIDGGTLVIRSRDEKNYRDIAWQFNHSQSDYIPSKYDDPTWWSDEHTFVLEIQRLDDVNKRLTITLDGHFIDTFDYVYVDNDAPIYSGYYTWSDAVISSKAFNIDSLPSLPFEENDLSPLTTILSDALYKDESLVLEQNNHVTLLPGASLYIPLDYDEYRLTLNASTINSLFNGYGLFFDGFYNPTTNKDKGYIMMFDRTLYSGFVGIVQDNWYYTDGIPSYFNYSNSTSIPDKYKDSIWWFDNHEMMIEVMRIDEDTKAVAYYLDGELLDTITYDSSVTDDLFYGLRADTETYIFSLELEDLSS